MKWLCGFAVSHIVTHYYAASQGVAWSLGLSVALSVCHTSEPCKNVWNDQAAICVLESGEPNEPCIIHHVQIPTWEGAILRGKQANHIGTLYGHLCRHGSTDPGAVSVVGSHGPNASCVTWEVQIPRGKGLFWWIGAPIVKYRHFLP